MAVLTVQQLTRAITVDPNAAGLVAAASGGDSFANTGVEFVIIKNGSGGTLTVTLVIQSTVDSQVVTNKTLAIPTLTSCIVGGFPVSNYNDANGRMNFTYSGVTTLSIGVFKYSSS